jgi:predicted dehydrogenase
VSLPLTSASAVYDGVSKEQYDTSRAARKRAERRAVQPLATRKNGETVRVGLIGLDTTHATAFTGILNDPNNPFHIPGARVVVAYPGGSSDMPISISRVGGFTDELRDNYGVQIVDAPESVAERSDLVFIIASDGRTHPGLLRSVASYGKPIFVDKPFAVSASDATEMFARASEAGIPIFASSAFRYADDLVNLLQSIRAAGERVRTCSVFYCLQVQETQGRYFWYGIHASEMLLAVMGKGVCEVEASTNGDQDTINVWHEDGRQSRLIGSQSDGTFRVGIETDKRRLEVDLGPSNPSLAARVLAAALDVLTEGKFPRLWAATTAGSVSGSRLDRAWNPDEQETLEVIGLLDAAQRSHAALGRTSIERPAVPTAS